MIGRKGLAAMIDHTNLKPNATREDILRLCREGREYGFASVCVNSTWVGLCAKELEGSGVKVCSVVGFPLGAMDREAKAFEAKRAVELGADEIDMVMNIGRFLSGGEEDIAYVEEDIRRVVDSSGRAVVKVILEVGFLSDEQVREACEIARRAGAHFVKTSTGFGPPWEMKHLRIMRETVGDSMGVKAAGGIRDYSKALEAIEAGATRIGASAGVKIVEGAPE